MESLSTQLPGLAFLGYSLFLANSGATAPGFAPFMALCGLVLGGLAAGYAHNFALFHELSVYGGILLGAGSLTGLLRRSVRLSPRTRQSLGVACALAALLVYFQWYFQGIHLNYYDEFFWGAFAKAFHHENGVWSSLTALARDDMSQAYPPAPALLANTFLALGGPFNEESMAVSGMALVLCAAAVVWQCMRYRLGPVRALGAAFIAACLIRTIGAKCTTYYLPGYADYLQNALFAALLCVAVFETRPARALGPLLLGLPVLALCKQTGIVLCCSVLAAQALSLWARRTRLRPSFGSIALMLLLPAAAALMAWGSWERHAALHIAQSSGSGMLLEFRQALQDPLLLPSLKAYLWAAVERPLLVSPSLGWLNYGTGTLAFLLSSVGLYAFTRRKGASWDRHSSGQALLLALGLLGWFALHWYAGFVYFVEPDLHNAACYERYVGPFVAGGWTVFLLLVFSRLAALPHGGPPLRALLALLVVACVVLCSIVPWQRPAPLSDAPVRQKMSAATRFLEEHTPTGCRIYFIPSKGSRQEEWALRYFLLPLRHGTSLEPQALRVPGQPRPADKTFKVPPRDALLHLLQKNAVDYVFIYSKDAADAHTYLFEGAPPTPLLIPVSALR